MTPEVNVKRLRKLLDRFKRLARELARTQTYIDQTYRVVAEARRRSGALKIPSG